MKNPANAPLTFNDIVFEGRNKLYGAYLLRQIYHRHLVLATFIAISLFMLFLSIPLISRLITGEEMNTELITGPETVIELQDVNLIDEIEIIKPIEVTPPPPAAEATRQFTDIRIVENNTQADNIPEVDDLQNVHISTTTTDGNAATNPNQTIVENPTTSGTGTDNLPTPDPVFISVDQMPVFGSGEKEMMEYLSKNFRFPREAIRNGISGIVYLSFTVTKTGEIANVKVLKGLGYGLDEEAKRVVASMPAWNPGKQNGRPVSVSYNLPFRLNIN